ncbi:MAG: tRNA (adenosine(37)-N6)-threonylcarbamoyltransferase complex ATPase subunit type 1 TsaE [Litoreibacter sp.]|uniref:tRNA (adenosine(37)-N6)-threonylcarbamoyltransferase complex ATPase subunit type 1 TsaE n=1 Tax=Litoreibacter sp. TaxID=1969459 RepID=UPI0032972640
MTAPATSIRNAPSTLSQWDLDLASPQATSALATALAGLAKAGMCVLLNGPVGAGKSYLARATIQALMVQNGTIEDVPSPTFTLVQCYELGALEVWHADLYRLTNPDELIELGLEQAFEHALSLIEWPDRLGELTPDGAIEITLIPDADDLDRRAAQITGPEPLMSRLKQAMEPIQK